MLMPRVMTNNLFDTFFDPWFDDRDFKKMEKELFGSRAPKHLMETDIKEHKDGFEVKMNLPGYSKEDLECTIKDGYLTVKAQKTMDNKDEKEDATYICRERYEGCCQRTFYVGEGVEEEDIKACFKHGILTLDIPKKEQKEELSEKKLIAIEG